MNGTDRYLPIDDPQQKPSRREIAAMAMQGLLACPNFNQPVEVIASTSIRAADALIEQLNAESPTNRRFNNG
jgi:hypothetical protein